MPQRFARLLIRIDQHQKLLAEYFLTVLRDCTVVFEYAFTGLVTSTNSRLIVDFSSRVINPLF